MVLAANFHQLEGFSPARNDTVERHRDRLPALDGTVEHLAVDQLALIIDLHLVSSFGRRTRALDQYGINQPTRGLYGPWLRGHLIGIGLTFILFQLYNLGESSLLQLLRLGHNCLCIRITYTVMKPRRESCLNLREFGVC